MKWMNEARKSTLSARMAESSGARWTETVETGRSDRRSRNIPAWQTSAGRDKSARAHALRLEVASESLPCLVTESGGQIFPK
jgi:hypothetical protein